MAGKVMRMPTPAAPEKLQRQDENKVQKQEKEQEDIQKAEMPEEQVQKKDDEKIQKAELPKEQVQKQEDEKVQRAAGEQENIQRKGNGTPAVNAGTQAAIRSKTTGGQPLSSDVRSYMEPRFNADFSNVRVHNDAESAGLSNQLSARAFTHQNHIFFSRNQYQPGTGDGKQLLAHELTHTVQQGHSVQRSPQVSTTATPPQVQRLGVQDALDYFADKAYHIMGFRLLTILLGFNPINMRSVDRNAANLLRALIEVIPGGHFITQALDNHGVINKAAAWMEQKIATLGDIGSDIVASLKRFLDSLGWRDIFDLGGVWERAKSIFTSPISRLINFGISVGTEILKMVKSTILKPLAALAKGTRGYDLLCVLLGENPISDEPVPRNADTLIGGFMKLIGQEEIWKNLKKGNAVDRAWAWFQGALAGLLGFARSIPGRIVETLASLTVQDILTVAGAFTKVIGTFAGIAGDFLSWGLNQVVSLLEILFSVVAPGAMPYLKKAKGTFVSILKNPIGFAGNLVRAGKMGFQMFAARIGHHLKTALIKWLVGPLANAGVYIPKSFSLIEIVKLVLSVLGITWQNVRKKLVKIIPEPVLKGLEKTAGILVTLVKDGPVAAWEEIKAELSELKGMLITQVTEMVTTQVVKAAVTKLASMLNPAGAVIQAIIGIYNTISFFIEKAGQIAAVVGSFINSISAIAAGKVENAAKRVEQTMAGTLNVVLPFLAKFAGLGNIPQKIVGIINKIRKPIDKGMDKIVGWLGGILKRMKGGGKKGKLSSRKVKSLVFAAMGRPTRAKTPEAALAEKRAQAQTLLAQYQPKLKKGKLKVNIIDRSAKDVKKNAAVNFEVSVSSGEKSKGKLPINVEDKGALQKRFAKARSLKKFNEKNGFTISDWGETFTEIKTRTHQKDISIGVSKKNINRQAGKLFFKSKVRRDTIILRGAAEIQSSGASYEEFKEGKKFGVRIITRYLKGRKINGVPPNSYNNKKQPGIVKAVADRAVRGEVLSKKPRRKWVLTKNKHASKFVIWKGGKFVLIKKFIGKVRAKLYGAFTKAVKTLKETYTEYKEFGTKYRIIGPPGKIRQGIEDTWFDKKNIVTIEHTEPVVQHWVNKGKKTDQSTRKIFYNNQDKLSLLPKSLNSREGGRLKERYGKEVEEGFRGPDEKA